jgi:hypothetical protein
MPTIKLRQQQPLPPEGEHIGQARKVISSWSKPKPRPDGTTPESVQVFEVPLHLPSGKIVKAFLRVQDSCGWIWEQACKSGEMIPEGEEVRFTPDDFENRVFYFGIEHREYMGVTRADVKFHAKAYALQSNPALADVKFPNEAPKPIYLKAVSDSSPPPAAPSASAAPVTPPPPAPPVSEANGIPMTDPMEGISEDEFRQALEAARKLRKDKQNPNAAAA